MYSIKGRLRCLYCWCRCCRWCWQLRVFWLLTWHQVAQEWGQVDAGLFGKLIQSRKGGGKALQKAWQTTITSSAVTTVPDGNLVDFETLDSLGIDAHDLFHLLDQQQVCRSNRIAACRLDDLGVAGSFCFQHLLQACSFCLQANQDGFGLTFCDDRGLLCLSLSLNDQLLAGNFCGG